jgi:hypothetical protein
MRLFLCESIEFNSAMPDANMHATASAANSDTPWNRALQWFLQSLFARQHLGSPRLLSWVPAAGACKGIVKIHTLDKL